MDREEREATKRAVEESFQNGDYQKAKAQLQKLYEEKPEDPEVLNDLATLLYVTGDKQDSVSYYLQALRLDPQRDDVRDNMEALLEDEELSESDRRRVEGALKATARTSTAGESLETNTTPAAPSQCERSENVRPVGEVEFIHSPETPPSTPKTRRARIFTDSRCNARCRFCYYLSHDPEIWSGELIRKQLDFASRAGMRDVDFSGGESSLRKDFLDLVSYAADKGFRSVCTLTNGLKFADEDFMKAAVDAGLTEILFSVHGYDEENHDWLTQRKGAYRKIRRAVHLAHKHDVAVRTNTTVLRQNVEHLEDLATEIARKLGPFQSNLILFNEFSEAGSVANKFAIRYSDASRHVKRAVDALREEVPYVNVRYIPYCFMDGYEEHVCDYSQKIYDPFEWSQRLLSLCTKQFIDKPVAFYEQIRALIQKHGHFVDLDPASISANTAEELFVTHQRSQYVKAPRCRNCRYNRICDGVEWSYSCNIGLAELSPVSGEPVENPLEFREDFYDGYEKFLVNEEAESDQQHGTRQVHGIGPRGSSDTKVSVIIPTYNRSETLGRCLDGLVDQQMYAEEFEVIVVDDGSTDDTESVVRGYANDLNVYYHRQDNSGPAAARNLGVKEASSELVLIINDDTLLAEDALVRHRELHEGFGMTPKVAVLGRREFSKRCRDRVMNYLYQSIPLYTPLHRENRGYKGSSYFITFNLSAPRQAFFRHGFFDENFRTPLVEDTELGYRWSMNGARVYFDPGIRAWHDHAMTVEGWKDQLVRRYVNKEVLYNRHPEMRPQDYYMDADEGDMKAFIDETIERMEQLEHGLAALEDRAISSLPGQSFMGNRIDSVGGFTEKVARLYPYYKRYVCYDHFLSCRFEAPEGDTAGEEENSIQELFEMGQLEEAAELNQKQLSEEPRNPQAWSDAALIAFRRGKQDRARECARRAIELAPDSPSVQKNVAQILPEASLAVGAGT